MANWCSFIRSAASDWLEKESGEERTDVLAPLPSFRRLRRALSATGPLWGKL